MSATTRNEEFREDDAWFSDEQLTQVSPADHVDEFRSPIPTQMVSNGEYMPLHQTEKQQQVEARLKELADHASKKLGMSRRQFLASSGGMAAAFIAMNDVFGRFFNVHPSEMFIKEAYAANSAPYLTISFTSFARAVPVPGTRCAISRKAITTASIR